MSNTGRDKDRAKLLGKEREAIGRGYRQRLKDAFEGILHSYEELLTALRTGAGTEADKDANVGGEKLTQSAQVAQDQLTVQFASTNIVRLCETLASIAAELKTHLTMHNHSETVAYEEQRTKELNEFQKEVADTFIKLRGELGPHLTNLETAYYQSSSAETMESAAAL